MSYTEKIKFIEFWRFIATELGESQCRLNLHANHLKDLFATESDHRTFLKSVICLSYSRNNCHHLKDKLDVNTVLDVLGETAYSMQGEQADDLLDIELLEEICWLICQHYPNHIHTPDLLETEQSQTMRQSKLDGQSKNQARRAPVISLPNVKIRAANRRQ